MKRMIRNSTISREQAMLFLSDYDDDVIDFIQSYVDESSDYTVMEWQGDKLVDVTTEDDLDSLKYGYLRVCLGEGVVEDEDEFDRIVDALEVVNSR